MVENIGVLNLNELIKELSIDVLFRARWGFVKKDGDEIRYKKLINDYVYPIYNEIISGYSDKIFSRYIFKFFDCEVKNNKVFVHNNENIFEFNFPRQKEKEKLSISDFFKFNKFPIFVVSVDKFIYDEMKKLNSNFEYEKYFYLNGLGAELADISAKIVMDKMFKIFKIQYNLSEEYRVCRFSFGYPACPNLEDQKKIFSLLNPEKIGVKLTESFIMEPEFSVSAILGIDKNAKYFNI